MGGNVSGALARNIVTPISLWLLLAMSSMASAADRPNILLLLAEDMSARVGAFGDAVAVTPNLDALAAEGVRYDNVFTTSGVCAPSRAALITGVHQNALGAGHMRSHGFAEAQYRAVPPADVKAFPEHLRASGYFTYVASKLDYQFSGTNVGDGPFTIWDEEAFWPASISWRMRPPGKPFFGMYAFMETHESALFPRRGWPRSVLHLVMGIFQTWLHWDGEEVVRPGEVDVPPYYPDTPEVRSDIARHYNNIYTMDLRVGELLAELERDGLADDTIVIWSTDHGDGLPRAKREIFDSGIRVPMIIRWPDRFRPIDAEPGRLDHRLISFVDLAPQILELAGVAIPDVMDGRPFIDTPPRKYVFAAKDRMDEVSDRQRAVRDDRYKYIRNYAPGSVAAQPLAFRENLLIMRSLWTAWKEGGLDASQRRWFEGRPEEELYDLVADPHELVNLAESADHAETLVRLRGALEAWQTNVADLATEPEALMAERMWPGGKSPVTARPSTTRIGDELRITCTSEGASIGYRINDDDAWQLYTDPIHITKSVTRIDAKAVRYGWAESDAIRVDF
jgi:arylsulfatase A-like enzyme